MKRFLLFASAEYYPDGGWDDFKGDYASLGAATKARRALAAVDRSDSGYGHIVDTESMTVVSRWCYHEDVDP